MRACLRFTPDDLACRVALRSDERLLRLSDDAARLERAEDWAGAADRLRAFLAADARGLFRPETHGGLCRVEARAARAASGGRFGVGTGGAGREDAGEEAGAAAAAAAAAIKWCGAAMAALEAAVSESGAGDAGETAAALAYASVHRGWARLVRGMIDAADADLAAARRVVEDFALGSIPAGGAGETHDERSGDGSASDDEEEDEEDEAREAAETFQGFDAAPPAREPDRGGPLPPRWVGIAVEDLAAAVAAAREALKPADLYAVLGLTRADADSPDWRALLRRAYRRLALLYHPDKNPADPEAAAARFLEVSEAYKVLSDDARRLQYDATGRTGAGPDGPEAPPHAGTKNERGPPHGAAEEWIFRFDKRDVGADGVAKGKWVRKATGEEAEGERDVSGERRKNPCRRKHACVGGRGGTPSPSVLRGHARRLRTRVVDASSGRNAAAVELVVNHHALQTLELRFTLAHAPGGRRRTKRSADRDGDAKGSEPPADGGPTRALVRARLAALVRAVVATLDVDAKKSAEVCVVDTAGTEAWATAEEALVAAFDSGRVHRSISPVGAVTAAVKALGRAAVNAMARRGMLGSEATEREAALASAAERLCDNPVVSQRVLALPTEEELAEAAAAVGRGRAGAAGGADRWVYVVWGTGGGGGKGVDRARAGEKNSNGKGKGEGGAGGGGGGRGRGEAISRGYRVRRGDRVSYEVKWYPPDPVDPDDPVNGVDAAGESSSSSSSPSVGVGDAGEGEGDPAGAFVALDVECADGTRLSATDAVDQYGLLAHPSSDLRLVSSAHGTAGWLPRDVRLPSAMVGCVLTRWIAGCEHDHPARVAASLRNVRVLDEAGDVVYAALPSEGKPRVVSDDEEDEGG